ncbi:MAG: hypothetical protein QXV69_09225 [Sulfolobaceae archaeon]
MGRLTYLTLFLIVTSLASLLSSQASATGISEPALIIEPSWLRAPSLQGNGISGIIGLKIFYQADLKIFASKIVLALPDGISDIYGNSVIQSTIPASSNGQIILSIPITVSNLYNSSKINIFGVIFWFANVNNQTVSIPSKFNMTLPYYGYISIGVEPSSVITYLGRNDLTLLIKNLGTSLLEEVRISVLDKSYTFQNFSPNQTLSLILSIINFPDDLYKVKSIPIYITYKTQYGIVENRSLTTYISVLPKAYEDIVNVNVINSPDGSTLEPGPNMIQVILKNKLNINFTNIYLLINSTYPISNTLFFFPEWNVNQTIKVLTYIRLTNNVNNVPISVYLVSNDTQPKLLGTLILPLNRLGNPHILVSASFNASNQIVFLIKNLLSVPITNVTISIISRESQYSKSFNSLDEALQTSFSIPNGNIGSVNYTITYYVYDIKFDNSGTIKSKPLTYPVVRVTEVNVLDKVPLGNNLVKAVLAIKIKNLGNDSARNVQVIMEPIQSQLDHYVINLGDLQPNTSTVNQVFLMYDDRKTPTASR